MRKNRDRDDIILDIEIAIEETGITKSALAEMMGISPQLLNKKFNYKKLISVKKFEIEVEKILKKIN